ncbi:ABC transporter ATP-binding protein [Alkalicaulis satelles]|uniref:ABC transporter ATP-binding protein n=1 Tax=Alkalicaulis satelles TaxID=2609175 RepID=A0A5M6Z8W8_9PROT|nr:ABC transporter ATP-binding protein [Alkalicaulis satelles]
MLDDRVLDVRAATVRYAPGRPAVDGADLRLTCGRVTALLGPSGSGKSSLLRAIAGLEKLDGGEIRFENRVWSGPGIHLAPEQRRCGVVFQDYALFPHLSALNNTAFGLRGGDRGTRRAKALERLKSVELEPRAHAFPHQLSGGEQQRVALARALAPDPDVVLMDEPFSGLDRRLRGELRETTARALRDSDAATLLVTHDAEEALALADTIALMSQGRIIQTGAPDAVYLRPASLTAARLLGEVEAFEAVAESGRALTVLGEAPASGFEDGARVCVLARPETIEVRRADAQGAPAVITGRRPGAGQQRLICQLEDGREISARTALTAPHRPGDAVRLALDPDNTHVIPAEAG